MPIPTRINPSSKTIATARTRRLGCPVGFAVVGCADKPIPSRRGLDMKAWRYEFAQVGGPESEKYPRTRGDGTVDSTFADGQRVTHTRVIPANFGVSQASIPEEKPSPRQSYSCRISPC